jgi:two-component system sensor histidine kinase/response regulator
MRPKVAVGGQAALDALSSAREAGEPFALVLLDANMPEVDGFFVAEEIKLRPDLGHPAVILLTSSGESSEPVQLRDRGIAACLVKPVRQADLASVIAGVLEARGSRPLPAGPVAAPPPAPEATPQVTGVRVLLAEDNPVNQRVAARLLTKRGHRVTVANNGREALDALERAVFDIVLMDVQMPGMGGFEATAAIRERERRDGGRVRIVAMTAHALKGDRERCLAAGMDGYLAKPVDRLELFAAVEAGGPSAGASAHPNEAPAFDAADARGRLAGDDHLLAEI